MIQGTAGSAFYRGLQSERMRELAEIAGRYARPWYSKFGLSEEKLADTGADWYRRY